MRTRSKSGFAWMAWLNRNACEKKVQGKSATFARHWSTHAAARKQEAIALLRSRERQRQRHRFHRRGRTSATRHSPPPGLHADLGFSSTTEHVG